MDKLLQKIQGKLSRDNFLSDIAEKLSSTEFNSLMLEIFKIRAAKVTPALLLREFKNNRFVSPATISTIRNRELALEWLKYADKKGFSAITLSPVSPLGTCSSIGTVSQNKVISSLRGTEVVADASNVLALKIAYDFEGVTDKKRVHKYSTVHRHTRGQFFSNPNFSTHFDIFCMASGGFDTGSYAFVLQQLNEHIAIILDLLIISFPQTELYLKFFIKDENNFLISLLNQPNQVWSNMKFDFVTDLENKYYQVIQFKIFISLNGTAIDIADGGIVDWTQQLTGNKKLRTIISGVGIELAQKLVN